MAGDAKIVCSKDSRTRFTIIKCKLILSSQYTYSDGEKEMEYCRTKLPMFYEISPYILVLFNTLPHND